MEELILAPIESFTDRAIRELAINRGCYKVYKPIINSNRILNMNKIELDEKFDFGEYKDKTGIQIIGNDIDSIVRASLLIEEYCCSIDINMGCPSKNQIEQGNGSFWLKNPDKIIQLFLEMKKVIKIPISFKIRLGFDENTSVYEEIILKFNEIKEKMGLELEFLTIHGRFVSQGYSGFVNKKALIESTKLANFPICFNGDVKYKKDIEEFSNYTNKIMIGRSTRGNLNIFNKKSIYDLDLKNDEVYLKFLKNQKKELLEYLELAEKYNIKFTNVKNNVFYYFNFIRKNGVYKREIISIKDFRNLEKYCVNLFNSLINDLN